LTRAGGACETAALIDILPGSVQQQQQQRRLADHHTIGTEACAYDGPFHLREQLYLGTAFQGKCRVPVVL